MSKFFKALEHADRERAAQAAAAEAAAETRAPTEPALAAITVPPLPAAPHPQPVSAPDDQPPTVATVSARPDVPPVTSAVVAPPEAPTGVPNTTPAPAVPPPSPFTAPAPSPAYGAALRSETAVRGPRSEHRLTTVVHGTGELDGHLVSLLEPTSVAAEQYRAVRLHVEKLRHERGLAVLGVSSPGRGDGKTLTAINLAGALAQGTDRRVVLLEADLRHPGAAEYLGLPNVRGLSTYILEPSLALETVLVPVHSFSVIIGGPPPSMPYELLQSPRFEELLTTLRQRFDYVIVDTPPVLAFPDVGLLRDRIDGFLLVARAQHTPREDVQEALALIGAESAVGIVFNGDTRLSASNGRHHR